MLSIRHAIALAAVVISTQSLAAMPEGKDVATMGELIELCNIGAAVGTCTTSIEIRRQLSTQPA